MLYTEGEDIETLNSKADNDHRTSAFITKLIKLQTANRLETPLRKDTSGLIKEWVITEYTDPLTQKETSGQEVLLQCLYGTGSPWKRLREHAKALKDTELGKFSSPLLSTNGNFYYFMKKDGHSHGSFPELCLWLGVIDEKCREKMDENGFLSTQGLEYWCHEGYIDSTSYSRIYGKNLLREFYISGIFGKKLEEYQLQMKPETVRAIGGKFPGSNISLASRIKGKDIENRIVTTGEIFDFFGLPIPEKDLRRTVQANYLPPRELRKWLRTTYSVYNNKDEKVTLSGRDIFLQAFFSKTGFWPELQSQIKKIPSKIQSEIGGNIPVTDIYYRGYMLNEGFTEINPLNILIWLRILDEKQKEFVDNRGFLTIKGLRKWCLEGYECPHTGEHIYGENIIKEIYKSGHFRKDFEKYVDSLDIKTIGTIGGKIPKHEGSLSKRITGNRGVYTTISTLLSELGIEISENHSL